jgi:hypothetical protein
MRLLLCVIVFGIVGVVAPSLMLLLLLAGVGVAMTLLGTAWVPKPG